MDSKNYIIATLKSIGFSGSKTELRKPYQHLYLIVKPQKSKFGNHVYLNLGICYKALTEAKTPKLKDCQLTFRFRQMIMALKNKDRHFEDDMNFHLPELKTLFIHNFDYILNKKIEEFDDLDQMSQLFPDNIPVLDSNEEGVDYIEVVHYFAHKKQLLEYFKKSIATN